jgi:thiamine kinase-like enzyme
MEQGYSGSSVRRSGRLVEKVSSDEEFIQNKNRQIDLLALSQELAILPHVDRINGQSIFMEFVDGKEGLTLQNAVQVGKALRLFHDQRGYPHPCMTGVEWLIDMANTNLAEMHPDLRIPVEVMDEYPVDALIFSEPQFIEKQDRSIVFVDFEGMGMGSRYHDLGHMYYRLVLEEQPEVYPVFLQGYQSGEVFIDLRRVKKLAGIIAFAYAGFGLTFVGPAEAEKRMRLGLQLYEESSC